MKKAQGLSMNVIIIAAIALLVLVVLVAIFSGRMGSFTKDIDTQTAKIACPSEQLASAGCPPGKTQLVGNYDVKAGYICCQI